MQIQVAKIHNGYLVLTPPSIEVQRQAAREQVQPQPVSHFCSDYEEVCDYIKQFFTISVA